MNIQQSVHAIFNQLEISLEQLSTQQYCQKIDTLSDASIGQHVRHVVEMFACLQDGYTSGIVITKREQETLPLRHQKKQQLI